MSDIMFDDVEYNLKAYVIHDDENVKGFFGKYRWLSNFHICPVEYEGVLYPSSENAYQAAKIVKEERSIFALLTPYQSKKKWSRYTRLDGSTKEWDERKNSVMRTVLIDKFNRNEDVKQWLIETGNKYLEETNHWEDGWFGVDIKLGGENHLGKILMEIRKNLISKS